ELSEVPWHPRRIENHLPVIEPDHTVSKDGTEVETAKVPYAAGVEFYAAVDRKRDWQTGLTPSSGSANRSRQEGPTAAETDPVSTVVERLAQADQPALFQAILRPYKDWSTQRDRYVSQLEEGTASTAAVVREFVSPRDPSERAAHTPSPADRKRIEWAMRRNPARSFVVSARAVALTREHPDQADQIANSLSTTLRALDGPFHTVHGRVETDSDPQWLDHRRPGTQVYTDLVECHLQPVGYEAWRHRLPTQTRWSLGIVADASEVADFCVVDGGRLTPDGARALAARPPERAALTLPPAHQLDRYAPPGMALCMPLTHDREPYGRPLHLPPEHQDRHIAVVGATGAGKSVLLERAIASNRAATDGLDIVFDYKGGSTAEDYLRTHYSTHGSLDDVRYFDLSETLPALSFFNIEPLITAGMHREEARSRIAGHYEELLAGLMGPEQYGQAAESAKAVRNFVRVLFDPVYGAESYAHEDLYAAIRRFQREEDPPATADDRLAAYFDSLLLRDRDVRTAILGGAAGRVETIATDGRLAPVFNHVPDEGDPHLDFGSLLDEDLTIVVDFAGLEEDVKRALTIVVLSRLWTALKARADTAGTDTPLVNLYLEEARDVASTQLLDTLLAEGRSYGLSMTLGLQYPEQVATPDPERDTYQELLNETGTIVAGPIAVDTDLPRVLATEDREPAVIERQLNALGRGEWLVRPSAGFGDEPAQPFLGASLPPPAGHPESDEPLVGEAEAEFEAALEECQRRTREQLGIDHRTVQETPEEGIDADVRLDSLLPHTDHIPDMVAYHEQRHALQCESCESRHAATIDGMRDAIECCHSVHDVDRTEIPVCRLELKRSPAEVSAAEWSLTQLCFLQVVYNAQQRRYDALEYDLVRDSMVLLKDYVGIDNDAVESLIDAGLLRHDSDYPHLLYSVTPEGREAIGESHRAEIDFGHGEGDLWESTMHVLGVALGERWLEREHVADEDSPVARTHPYFDLQHTAVPDSEHSRSDAEPAEWRRLDLAGLDAQGDVVVAVEVERIHGDAGRSIPADYDKMAACDLDAALWIVPTKEAGREVFKNLRDPLQGEPRIGRYHPRLNTPPDDHDREEP
ncbi:MAG: ATP-binding protein, partial [Salinirussus sp.]